MAVDFYHIDILELLCERFGAIFNAQFSTLQRIAHRSKYDIQKLIEAQSLKEKGYKKEDIPLT